MFSKEFLLQKMLNVTNAVNVIKICHNIDYFAPIFDLNCEHVFFCLDFKSKKKKFLRIFKKKSRNFKNLNFFTKLKTFKTQFLKFFYHS